MQAVAPSNQPAVDHAGQPPHQSDDIAKLSTKSKATSVNIDLPPLDILNTSITQNNRTDRRKVIEKAKMLEEALRSFGGGDNGNTGQSWTNHNPI